jgi:hypothetical protein
LYGWQMNRRVIRLARYWKCRPILVRIAKEILLLSASITSYPEPTLFITAVGLEDRTLLGEIWTSSMGFEMVRYGLHLWRSRRQQQRTLENNPTYHYDFGCWSLDQYLSIPPSVMKAVEIARTAGGWSGQVDWDRVGWELVSLRYKARESTSMLLYDSADSSPDGPSNNWSDSTWPPKLYLPQHQNAQAKAHHHQGSSNEIESAFQEKWWIHDPPYDPPANNPISSVQKHTDTVADMVMKSSDGHSFRVSSAVLSNAS